MGGVILTIFIAVLFLAAAGAGAVALAGRGTARAESAAAAVGLGLFAVVVLLFSMGTVVSTRNVGIVTTFGRPQGELSNGFHWVAPWQSVTEMDGAIQLQRFEGEHAMPVRLGNNSTANVNVTIQWRLQPESAPSLFLDYRTFEGIRENLVDKELSVAMNSEFAKFDPLAAIATDAKTADASPAPADGAPLVAISEKVQHDVQVAVGERIEIQKIFVPLVTYDAETQERINAFNVEKANTRVAEQSKATASAQAEANRILSSSVHNDLEVITANCINQSLSKGLAPQGCWPLPNAGLTITSVGK